MNEKTINKLINLGIFLGLVIGLIVINLMDVSTARRVTAYIVLVLGWLVSVVINTD